MSFEMGLWVWCDFGQPVCRFSGLYSCIAGEFVCYVLLWNLLALGWWLVSVNAWRLLDDLLLLNVLCSQEFSGVPGFGLKSPASGFQSYSSSSLKASPTIQH